MKGCTWLVSVAALLLAGCGTVASVAHQSHPLIFPTITPGTARAAPGAAPGTTLYTYHVTGSGGITSLVWSPDSQRIATADISHNKILIWDASTGQTLLTLQSAFVGGNIKLAWAPDGKQLAASINFYSYSPSIVQLWDAATGALELNFEGPDMQINALAYSPDSSRIAVASADSTVSFWNTSTGDKLFAYHAPGPVNALAWSPDGTQIAIASLNAVQLWNISAGAPGITYSSHASQITSVAWSPDGHILASGAADGTAQTWDAATGKTIATYTNPQGNSITDLSWSPNNQYLVTGSTSSINGDAIQVWQATTGSVILTYPDQGYLEDAAWSPDGTRIASSHEQTVRVWVAP